MKKLILSVFAVAFLFGCAGKKEMSSNEDGIAELQALLAGYNHVCADIAFKDARLDMEEVYRLRDELRANESDEAYLRARENYESGLIVYKNSVSALDALNAEMKDQKSRLNDLRADGMKYASKEFTYAEGRVNALHATATTQLATCDVENAKITLDEAEKELRYVEDLTAMRMNSAAVVTTPATETYTVVKGDSLWRIAANKYSNPYFWPLIYWANKSSIKDPDLIFPNQKLTIERNQDESKKSEADKFARTRGPWSLFDGK